MKDLKILRAFSVQYYGPTCYKGARVKIQDMSYGDTVFIPYNYSLSEISQMGQEFLESLNIPLLFATYGRISGVLLLSDDLETRIK